MNNRVLYLKDGLMQIISSVSVSSVSVFEQQFFYSVKFCSASIVSLRLCNDHDGI